MVFFYCFQLVDGGIVFEVFDFFFGFIQCLVVMVQIGDYDYIWVGGNDVFLVYCGLFGFGGYCIMIVQYVGDKVGGVVFIVDIGIG